MKIPGGNGGPQRPDRVREVTTQPVGPRERRGARTPSQIEKHDRVEISDAGRAKASHVEQTTPNTPERLNEIRRRVLTGAYDTDAVVGEVARRILDRGDV
jgi:anti-sigma28 factor (negative regulator of flagellin synthesis)